VIAAVVALVRYVGGTRQGDRPGSGSGGASAEELLAERFTRGEIDADEYTRRHQLLRAGR
jgi:putative membrane protein